MVSLSTQSKEPRSSSCRPCRDWNNIVTSAPGEPNKYRNGCEQRQKIDAYLRKQAPKGDAVAFQEERLRRSV